MVPPPPFGRAGWCLRTPSGSNNSPLQPWGAALQFLRDDHKAVMKVEPSRLDCRRGIMRQSNSHAITELCKILKDRLGYLSETVHTRSRAAKRDKRFACGRKVRGWTMIGKRCTGLGKLA